MCISSLLPSGKPRSLPFDYGLFLPVHLLLRNQNCIVKGLEWKKCIFFPGNWIRLLPGSAMWISLNFRCFWTFK